MGNPYAFGTYSAETKVLQERLSGHAPSFDSKGTDGIFGKDTRDAVQAAQEYYAISPADGVVRTDLLVELGITSPAAAVANNPLSQFLSLISLFRAVTNLAKGKTMTKDQIEGTIRTVLAALAAYLAGKGYFPQISPELLTAITTVLVGAWSLWSNRPKTIQPIGK